MRKHWFADVNVHGSRNRVQRWPQATVDVACGHSRIGSIAGWESWLIRRLHTPKIGRSSRPSATSNEMESSLLHQMRLEDGNRQDRLACAGTRNRKLLGD